MRCRCLRLRDHWQDATGTAEECQPGTARGAQEREAEGVQGWVKGEMPRLSLKEKFGASVDSIDA